VSEASSIDGKVDDGLPTSGYVQAMFPSGPANTGADGWGVLPAPYAAAASTTTCYDTTSGQYSMAQNGGNGMNCGLSFKFQ
jgi:hypothetical protein